MSGYLQGVSLRSARDVDEGRQPVERGEQLVRDRPRLNMTRPADNARRAITAFPGFAFLTFERRDAAVRERDRLRTVVAPHTTVANFLMTI